MLVTTLMALFGTLLVGSVWGDRRAAVPVPVRIRR